MNFIKDWLNTKRTKDVAFDNIVEFFDHESTNVLSEQNIEIDDLLMQINKSLKKLTDMLDDLVLQDPDEEFEDKKAAQQYKEGIIKDHHTFIKKLQIQDKRYTLLTEFCSQANELISQYFENEVKGMQYLSNHYELAFEVMNHIKKMDQLIVRLTQVLNDPMIKTYKAIDNKIKEITQSLQEADKIATHKDTAELAVLREKKKRQALELRLKTIKQSSGFKQLKKLQDQEEECKKKLTKLSEKLSVQLKPFLSELSTEYLEDPLNALALDESFDIIETVHSVKDKEETPQIKKKIEFFTPSNLQKIMKKRKEIKDNLATIYEEMEKIPVVMNYKDITYKLDHSDKKYKELLSQVKEQEKQYKQHSIESKVKQLERLMHQFFGYEISIHMIH